MQYVKFCTKQVYWTEASDMHFREMMLCTISLLQVYLYSKEILFFLHETGTDRRDTFRTKGYSLTGKPVRSQKLLLGESTYQHCLMSTEACLLVE